MDALSKITNKLLLTSIVLVAICSMVGLAGRYYWLFDLFSHFRMYYLFATFFLLGLSLYLRMRTATAVTFLIFTLNALLIFSVYKRPTVDITHTQPLKLLSLNVNHDVVATEILAKLVEDYSPDVVVLAETSHKRVFELSRSVHSYTNAAFAPREGRDTFGVGVLVNDTVDAVLGIEDFSDADILGVTSTVTYDGRTCIIVGIHMMYPFGHERTRVRNQQLRTVADRAKDSSCFVAIGDMNITPWSPVFGKALKTGNLKDSRVGFGIQTSWPIWLPVPLRIPIDHALVSKDVQVLQREVLENVGSDHLPILVTLGLPRNN